MSIDPGRTIRAGQEYVYLKRSYAKAIAAVGGSPVLITPELDPRVVGQLCSALVISGGEDLPIDLVGEPASSSASAESAERIQWERKLIDVFGEKSKPILGVCYGMQLMNLHFGGTLMTDNRPNAESTVNHGGWGVPTKHYVNIVQGSHLFDTLGPRVLVSSSHHQILNLIAPIFKASARADDGVIEAIESNRMLAVEWHPESDGTSAAIYGYLMSLVR